MTAPGGNRLPTGSVLTLANLESRLQDLTPAAMRGRALDWVPSVMGGSTGGDAAISLSPFGFLFGVWAEFNSLIANANPADITSPEDLPALLINFIEGLPFVGQFIGILEAVLGDYTGDDANLQTLQTIFAPIRAIVDAIEGAAGGLDDFDIQAFFDLPGDLIGVLFGGSSILPQLQPDAVGGVTPGANLLTDVGDFIKNLFNGITRSGATSANQNEASTAVSGQTDIVLGTAATLAALAAGFGPGNNDSDDFERTSSTSLGSNWSPFFSVTGLPAGPLGTPDGHNLHYAGGSNTEWLAIKNNLQSAGDDMEVTIVLAQAIPAWPYFTPLPFGGSIDVWIRCNLPGSWAARTGVRMRVTSAAYTATVALHNVIAGAETSLASVSMAVPSTGGALTFRVAGYDFEGFLNGGSIGGFVDASHVTNKGSGFRYRGAGGRNTGGKSSPDLTGWTATG